MAHQIEKYDTVVATEETWHGLEKRAENITYENSGLDWQVDLKDLQIEGGQIVDKYRLICTTAPDNTLLPLGIARNYQPIQNERIFQMIQNSLKDIPHKIVTAGSYGNRAKVWSTVKLLDNEGFDGPNGDKFKAYMNFLSSHDGSMSLEIFDSNIRVVCANTFNFARSGKLSSKVRHAVRHSLNSNQRISNVESSIQNILNQRKAYVEKLHWMSERAMSKDEAEQFLAGWLVTAGAEKLSKQFVRRSESIVQCFQSGRGNFGKSRYDMFNGVTEYFTHRTNADGSSRFADSEFGTGSVKKGEAFDALSNDDIYEKFLVRGDELLTALS